MNIGIVVYSKTGNTYSVAIKLQEKLENLGHSVGIERIEPADVAQTDAKKIDFVVMPQLESYEALVFCSPVHAFSLAPVMSAFLTKMPSVGNKKTVCFVTKQLRAAWMGGNRAIATMKKSLAAGGTQVIATGMIFWSSQTREDDISNLVENLSNEITKA